MMHSNRSTDGLFSAVMGPHPSRARARPGRFPLLPVVLMAGAVLGSVLLIASLVQVGPTPVSSGSSQLPELRRKLSSEDAGMRACAELRCRNSWDFGLDTGPNWLVGALFGVDHGARRSRVASVVRITNVDGSSNASGCQTLPSLAPIAQYW